MPDAMPPRTPPPQDSTQNAQNPQDARDSNAKSAQNDGQNVIHLDENLAGKVSSKLKSLKDSAAKIGAVAGKIKGVGGKIGGIFGKVANAANALIAKLKTLFKNKIALAIAGAGVLLLAIIVVVVILALNKSESPQDLAAQVPQSSIKKPARKDSTKIQKPQGNELQALITKAALLYNRGHITEALDTYSNISLFSQSFASFNLGVARLKENDLPQAQKAFNDTISSGENVASAAINNAFIAHRQGNAAQYDYYVNLAQGTMAEWFEKPLFSYLYAITNFYSAHYFNALSALNHPSSNFYSTENALLASKIYLNFGDDYNALKKLLEVHTMDNRLNIGLLYARMGEFDLAAENINGYMHDRDSSDPQANMALALIELKRAHYPQSAEIYNKLMRVNEAKDLTRIYPIRIKLKDSLFDINLAQKHFWNRAESQQMTRLWHYKILFYFAPYRVFDIEGAITLINDGGLQLRMNNLQEAATTLSSGVMLSRINQNITQGLKAILNHNINEALRIMQDSAQKYPNHPVLQYNLGLIYAQLNDFENARKAFTKAYHLDSHDILSGIFAVMCAQLTNNDPSRILGDLALAFEEASFESDMQSGFYRSLLGFANGNLIDNMLWFDKSLHSVQNAPLMFALNALYSLGTRDKATIEQAFLELKAASNDDIVAVILARVAEHYGESVKRFALSLFDFYKRDLRDMEAVFAGPSLARQIYVFAAFMVGANSYVDEMLNDRLLNAQGDVRGILQALALNAIYLRDFERAFAYYNELIDAYGMQNAETYFYAAVAAVGAKDYDNAVALIQLARMDNAANFEARYALGLLHQAMGNLSLASMQFAAINKGGFVSNFFDFEIDSSEMLKAAENRGNRGILGNSAIPSAAIPNDSANPKNLTIPSDSTNPKGAK